MTPTQTSDNVFKISNKGQVSSLEVEFDNGEISIYLHSEANPDGNEWLTDGEENLQFHFSKKGSEDFYKWIIDQIK